MGWAPTVYTAGGAAAGVVSATLAVVGWRSRSKPYAEAFTALMLGLAAWAVLYGVQLGFDTTGEGLLFQRLASAAGAAVPTLWFVFALRYAGFDGWLTRRRLAALAVEPAAFGGLAATNGSHELIWAIDRTDAGVATSLTTLGDVHAAYSYTLSSVAILALVVVALRGSAVYRRQAALLVCGATLPLTANVAFVGGVTGRDLTPFAYVVTGAVWGVGLFEADLLNRAPIAHRQAITEVGDGLVVFDTDGQAVHVEGVARAVFDPPLAVGDSVERLHADGGLERSGIELPAAGGEERATTDEQPTGGTEASAAGDGPTGGPEETAADPARLLAEVDGETQRAVVKGRQRAYDLRVSPIRDHRDRETGYLLVVRDVTRREAYQQRLEVTNRVLRHNLRNDMNVVAGHASSIEKAVDSLDGADEAGEQPDDDADAPDADAAASIRTGAHTIQQTAERLLDTARKAREMSQLPSVEPGATELTEPTRAVVASFRSTHPEATIRFESPESVRATVGGERRYRIALESLLENAVEHHDGTPTVFVRIEAGQPVAVTVTDDGPGIPETERATFAAGTETDLQHASGLGLWLVYWVTNGVGGELTFHDREPRGTVVRMSFPAAE